MSKPVRSCRPGQQHQVKKMERVLGVKLPACSTVSKTGDGGVKAVQTGFVGNVRVLEISGTGQVFFSSYCSDEGRVLGCKDMDHVQHGSVSPAKLAAARKLIPDKK